MIGRLFAAAIALSAVIGIGLEQANLMGQGQPALRAAWALAAYFTILSNALVAVLFAAIAIRGARFDRPRLVGGMAATMALVGVIFTLFLQDLRTLAGATATADFLLHRFNPIAVVAFWLLMTRKGALSWRDPFLWALYPLGYLLYALIRGAADGAYSYPFIDVSELGWTRVLINAAVIAGCFVAASEGLVLVDRLLEGRRARA